MKIFQKELMKLEILEELMKQVILEELMKPLNMLKKSVMINSLGRNKINK
jgi:hypothetical protein